MTGLSADSSFKEKGLQVIAAYAIQYARKTQLFEEFYKLFLSKKIQLDPESAFVGYSMASLFVDILKKISGQITKENILNVIKINKIFSIKGINHYLDPNNENIYKNFQFEDKDGNVLDITGKKIDYRGSFATKQKH
jgi:hypothetical protein